MIKTFIGKRIREFRTACGYSQEKFAAVCGLDRTYIAGVELGKRNISIENLNKIAEALDLTLAELCDGAVPPHRNILLTIDGETFLLMSKNEITPEIRDEIEILCRCAYDDDVDNPFVAALGGNGSIEELCEADAYDMAGYFQSVVKNQLGIDVIFQSIDLEVSIDSYQ